MKKIKILIIICVIFILIIGISLIYISKNNKENSNNNQTKDNIFVDNTIIDPGVSEEDYNNVVEEYVKIQDFSRFYTVENCLKKYIKVIRDNNTEKLNEILDKEYSEQLRNKDSKIINLPSIDENSKIIVNQIYGLYNRNVEQYVVEFYKVNSIGKEKLYSLVCLNLANMTYSVKPIVVENIEEVKLKEKTEQIEIKTNNTYEYPNTNLEMISRYYYNYYRDLLIYMPEKAYEFLDADYKKQKFNNNYKEFEKYIALNLNNMKNSAYSSYIYKDGEYKILNTYKNVYILRENKFMDFTIKLDNYTIIEEEDAKKLSSSTAEDIAKQYVYMINNKDYSQLYNSLDNQFKESKYPSLEYFKNYIKNNFYDINYISSEIESSKSGNNYIVTLKILDRVSKAANSKKVTFVMGTDETTNSIKMSFSM